MRPCYILWEVYCICLRVSFLFLSIQTLCLKTLIECDLFYFLSQARNSYSNEVVAIKKMSYNGKQTTEVRKYTCWKMQIWHIQCECSSFRWFCLWNHIRRTKKRKTSSEHLVRFGQITFFFFSMMWEVQLRMQKAALHHFLLLHTA